MDLNKNGQEGEAPWPLETDKWNVRNEGNARRRCAHCAKCVFAKNNSKSNFKSTAQLKRNKIRCFKLSNQLILAKFRPQKLP